MFPLSARKFHSLLTLPILLPLLLLASPKVSDNSAPVAVDDSYTVHGNTNIGPLLANDTDPDGAPISVAAFITTPHHGLLFNSSPADVFNYRLTLGYTGPNQRYLAQENHTSRIRETINPLGTATAALNVINNPPTPVNKSFTVHGLTLLGDLLTGDSDPDGDNIYFNSIQTYPQHGTLFTNPSLQTPAYSPNSGYTGPDSFVYQICDSLGLCANATVSLNAVNSAPTPLNKSFTVHGYTLLGDLLSGDSDPDGDSLYFTTIQTYPQHGSLFTSPSLQTPAYSANSGYTGPDSFVYQICDSLGLCANATVSLNAVNSAPTPLNKSFTVHGLTLLGDLLTGDSDPDGDNIYFNSIQTYPQHGTLFTNPSLQTPAYSANSGYTGPDSFVYQICDSLGLCANATVSLNALNSAPTPLNKSFTVHGYMLLGDLLSGSSDPDGDSIDFNSIQTYPQHGSLFTSPSLQTPAYSPNSGYTGPDSFTYRICDSLGLCGIGTVTLTVLPNDGLENCGTGSCNSVGEPVNVTNGNMYLQQSDYSLPGVGPAINITRTYNSISQNVGLFGKGWSTDYDESVKVYSSTYVRWFRADGQATNFMRSSGAEPFTSVESDFHGSMVQNGDGTFTVTFTDASVHRFSSTGKLLSLADRMNNQSSLAYDINGKLISITDPFGRVLAVTPDANGRVNSISDSLGAAASYTYGASGELLTVSYPDTSGYRFSYTTANSNLVLASVTDALGNVLESHTYDSQGRALTSEKQGGVEHYNLSFIGDTETDVTDALGHISKYFFDKTKGRNVVTSLQGLCSCGSGSQTQSWTYDSQLNVNSHTNALGQIATYTYDSSGNKLSATGVLGTSSFTYNQFGEVLTATDAMGGVTTNTFDPAGNLLSVTDTLNNPTTFTYDARGQLLTMTNARGKVTTLTYSTSGNLAQATDALNGLTKFTYDARGRLTSATDALNFVTTYAYDAAGRVNKITRPDNTFITFTYDLAGRRTKVTDALNNSTTFAYDGAYRLTSQADALLKSVSYTYDSMSNLISATDQLAHTTNIDYDEFNRPIKTTYPPAVAGGTRLQETVEYDAVGNVTKRTDTAGRVTTLTYDNANRLISVTDPALQVTQYEYNSRSNVTAVIDALAQRYTFDYDALGRVTATTRAGMMMSFAYDAVGNRIQRTDYNNVPTSYTYDALNRLTKITYPDATTATYAYDKLSHMTAATNLNGAVSFVYDSLGRATSTTDVWGQVLNYTYDANGRRTKLSFGATTNATYTYDVLNRLTKITDSANLAVTFAYDAGSRLTSKTLPNGVAATYTYDDLDRLTRLKDAKGNTLITDNNYTYNTAGDIIQNVDQTGTHSYGYDALDRLTAATYTGTPNESYAYDGVGNRTNSHKSGTYSYQPFNRLTSTSTATYLYNNNGNMISKSEASGTTQFAWDFENRLVQVVTPSAGSASYKYDALGRRIQRTPSSGISTNFVYDGQDVVKDINSDGTTVEYLNGPGVDNKIRQKGSSTTTTYYFSQDHLGSTNALTGTTGKLVERITYDAYGNSADSTRTRYGFTGRERDLLTGLMYYRARFYEPQLGRFISEDPIGFEGGLNWFSYVENNPTQFADPYGLVKGDKWYGYNNRDFQRWFHRCWKQPGDPDADKHGIEAAHAEWVSRGSPKGGNCWGGGTPNPSACKEPFPARRRAPGPTLDELRMQEESARQMERFWMKILIGDAAIGAVVLAPEAATITVIRWIWVGGRLIPVH